MRPSQNRTQGRMPEAGDLLQPERGSGDHWDLEGSRSPRASSLVVGLPAARTHDDERHRTATTRTHNHAVIYRSGWSKIPVMSGMRPVSLIAGTMSSRWTASKSIITLPAAGLRPKGIKTKQSSRCTIMSPLTDLLARGLLIQIGGLSHCPSNAVYRHSLISIPPFG
jgi:hypothetical protein